MEAQVDIAVVGGGLAGLSAALRASATGASTVVLEKGDTSAYACNSRMAMGYMRIGGLDMEADPAAIRAMAHQVTKGAARPELVEALATRSAEAIAWLRRQGATLIRDRVGAAHASLLAPPAPRRPGLDWPGRGADRMLRRLETRLTERGGTVRRGLRVEAIEATPNGYRLRAEDRDGSTCRLHARAVVLADGGFQANADLLRRHVCGRPERLLQRNAGTGCGDGLRLATGLGAATTAMDRFYGHVHAREALSNPRLWPYPAADLPILSGIAVDAGAQRFADEGLGGIFMANAIARLPDPLEATAIFDARTWHGMARQFIIPANPLLVTAGATVHCAQNLRALAGAAALPHAALEETVAGFNRALKEATPAALSPARSTHLFAPSPIENPPFFAVPLCAGITYTMGGIRIDGRGRVLDAGNEAIAGLFAAGSVTGGHEGGPNAGYTGGLAKALVFGINAGDEAARFLRAA